MLLELLVENYAVVEKVRIVFHPGFNVLTGETGSGKSLVVDALGLLFGGRTSADMVRTGASGARVSGIFDAPRTAVALLQDRGIETEEDEILIEREILSSGKSRAFVCNRPATASLLRDLAPALGDIHGQHDQQRLFVPSAQLDIVDEFGDHAALLDQVADVFRRLRRCDDELDEIQKTEQEKLRLLDLWTFQRGEIESAQLKPGEDTELENERKVLQNVGRLLEAANFAYDTLYDSPESASVQLKAAAKRVEELCRIDNKLETLIDTLKTARVALDDASSTLRDYMGGLEADPDRLEQVESHLAAIEKLKRKYGSTVEQVIAFGADVQAQIAAAESTSERRAAVEAERKELAAAFQGLTAELSARRRAAAELLSKRVQTELKSLAMDKTTFQIGLEAAPASASGTDALEFLVSANVGEVPRPLDKIASGGELSRVALALKTCATGAAKGRTLVFDEVDAGIGGMAAESVGKKLKAISARSQVLCVTHLAQIAGFADHHFAVEKKETKGRTIATAEELTGDARTREIGRMLSGQHLTPEALRHAEQLIRSR